MRRLKKKVEEVDKLAKNDRDREQVDIATYCNQANVKERL